MHWELSQAPDRRPRLVGGGRTSGAGRGVSGRRDRSAMAERAWTTPGAATGGAWPAGGPNAAPAGLERRSTGMYVRLDADSRRSTCSCALLAVVATVVLRCPRQRPTRYRPAGPRAAVRQAPRQTSETSCVTRPGLTASSPQRRSQPTTGGCSPRWIQWVAGGAERKRNGAADPASMQVPTLRP